MNRIIFEPHEIVDGIATFGGVRATHIMSVLHGEIGQVIKTGLVDGLIGTSEIISIEKSSNEEWQITARVSHTQESLRPWVDLILAPPRPRAMKRLLPQLATLGVGRIILVGAKKVEKDFWGATLLKEENYKPLLIDGLMQAGTSILPTLETRRNFRSFLNEELDVEFKTRNRILAHPCKNDDEKKDTIANGNDRLLLAIGPEGGWTDNEVTLFEEKGFSRYSLGGRILRTDTATIALLARLSEIYDRGDLQE